jgi:Protein of unknown function (DUF4236)/Bacterial SH3 domain
MGWRFRRSFRIVPGIRLNMGSAGFTSISLGGHGATLNLGKRGATSTVSLPGTGLSYRHQHKNPPLVQPPVLPARPAPGRTIAVRAGLFAVLVIGGYLALRSPTPTEPSTSAVPVAVNGPIPLAVASPVVILTRKVTTLQATVRGSPSMSGSVVRPLMQNQVVQVLQIENGWTRVALPDGEPIGWMHNSVLKVAA